MFLMHLIIRHTLPYVKNTRDFFEPETAKLNIDKNIFEYLYLNFYNRLERLNLEGQIKMRISYYIIN